MNIQAGIELKREKIDDNGSQPALVNSMLWSVAKLAWRLMKLLCPQLELCGLRAHGTFL